MARKNQISVKRLRTIYNDLNNQKVGLQVVGRKLTPDETNKIEILDKAIKYIGVAIEVLESEEEMSESKQTVRLKDGLYIATNDQLKSDLRIDIKGTNIISMDIFGISGENLIYLASLRTNPGAELSESQNVFEVICEDKDENTTRGKLTFTTFSDVQVSVELKLEDHLYELPSNYPVLLSAQWKQKYFRKIGMETEQEENVMGVPSYKFEGKTVTVESCFENAGIKLIKAGERDNIPPTTKGWDDAQLHALMSQFADESLDRKDWLLHLLLLSKAKLSGLLGIMFDTGVLDLNNLPRQGVAVFLNAISGNTAGIKRKIIKTIVHELGHALNLVHRFEREVGRADSTSFMNYDWLYLGGNNTNKYWKDFRFTFDEDEIKFMRHAPWPKIIPGGAEFHTIKYWYEGTGGYSPYAPEIPLSDLELLISPPPTGHLFGFGTPVFLSVTLVNKGSEPLDIPAFYLDPKAGFLEILVRRQTITGDSRIIKFKPVISRCFDIGNYINDVLDPGQSMSNNINLTFGSSGFTFAEPGNYEITAVLSIYSGNYNYVVKSEPLFIRIEYPKTREEELDALEIFNKDVGYYLALGGSDYLTGAESKLLKVRDRRQGIEKIIADPLVAYITRCIAINLSRDFITYKEGKFKIRKAESVKAVELFSQLKANEDKIFDKATLSGTRSLMNTIQKEI
jgi:hypothetical protein